MTVPTTPPAPPPPGDGRLPRVHTFSAAGLAAAGAAALVFAAVPQQAHSQESRQTLSGSVRPTAWHAGAFSGQIRQKPSAGGPGGAPEEAGSQEGAGAWQEEDEDRKKAAFREMARAKAAYAADQRRKAGETAGTEAAGPEAAGQPSSPGAGRAPAYADNMDGWIREALAIMKEKGIPGTYEGIRRNVIRESGGNPRAVNNWDVNARNGVPSKGLLQVIKPTFDAYHVEGTSWDPYDPVANITTACNYAAKRYGSIDNVFSAY